MTQGLAERFLEPPGWRWGFMQNSAGKKLRFGCVKPEQPEAAVIILPGRTEYAEKYFETTHDLLRRNFAVWILDWQGQGLSDRYIASKPQRSHATTFLGHVSDAHEFIQLHVKPGATPLVMLAQSMGANIGLRYLDAHPNTFRCATLCAPMLGIQAVNDVPAGKLIARIFSLLAGKSYAFGQKDWHENERAASDILFSNDAERSIIHDYWLMKNEKLRSGGVTFRWLNEALTSCRYLRNPAVLRSIKTPCLIAMAGAEKLVDNAAIRHAVSLMPHAQLLELPGAGHEILMEGDNIRNKFLESFTGFVKANLKMSHEQGKV